MKKFILAILMTILLVAGGVITSRLITEKCVPNWDMNEIYAIWIEGAEVSSDNPDGKQWHDDGTAPNLVATLTWRNNMLLETPESSNSLIAKWERTSIKIKDLMKTELAPNALEKVARVHAAPEELLALEVRDRRLLSAQWIGAVAVPCGKLKPGKNTLLINDPNCGVRSITLQVVPSGTLEKGGTLPGLSQTVTEGILVMAPPPPSEAAGFNSSTAGKMIQQGVKAISDFFGNAATNN
jgi:hypothetical protein